MSKPKKIAFIGRYQPKKRFRKELTTPSYPKYINAKSESKPKLNEFDLKDITFEERKVLLHALLPDEEAEKHLEMLIKESRQETLAQVETLIDDYFNDNRQLMFAETIRMELKQNLAKLK